MKMRAHLLLFASVLLLAPLASRAQTEAPKILVVDMVKLLDEHYSTAEQNAKLSAEQDKANADLDKIQKEINDLVTEYKDLDEKSKNPALNDQARSKAASDAQAKYAEIQQKNNEGVTYRNNFTSSMTTRIQNFRDLMFDEIGKIATDIAKKKGATLLLDKSAVSALGSKAVVYSDPTYDITDEVLAEINRTRPVTAVTSPSATPPATGSAKTGTTTAPAASAPAVPAAPATPVPETPASATPATP